MRAARSSFPFNYLCVPEFCFISTSQIQEKKKTFVFCVIFFSFFCFWFYYVSCCNSMESIYNLLYVYAFIKHILTTHFRLLTLWIWTTTRKICFFFLHSTRETQMSTDIGATNSIFDQYNALMRLLFWEYHYNDSTDSRQLWFRISAHAFSSPSPYSLCLHNIKLISIE